MKIKKIISSIISATMCFTVVTSNVSADTFDTINKNTLQNEYAFDAMSRYISVQNINNENSITISEPITLYNFDDTGNNKTLYFAIDNNELIGMMTVDVVNNEFASSYTSIDYNELNSAYNNSTPVSLSIINECLVLSNGNSNEILINPNGVDININQRSLNSGSLCSIKDSKQTLELVNYNTRSIILNQQLNVSRVSNTSVNKIGICWAATVAQNVNYMNGTSYTATGIYNLCANNYSGTPSGNSIWYKRAYNLCGIDVTIKESAINYNQIYGLLSNNRPIGIFLSDNDGIKHAVSLSGITVLDTPSIMAYYYIVDPNVGTVAVEVSYSVMLDGEDFYYPTSYGYTFTGWHRSVYKS